MRKRRWQDCTDAAGPIKIPRQKSTKRYLLRDVRVALGVQQNIEKVTRTR